jgi:macrolide transport system ATP-binding/permease protein
VTVERTTKNVAAGDDEAAEAGTVEADLGAENLVAENPETPALRPSRISLRDLWSEAVAACLARPARAALTVLGTVLGIAALVATLGVSKTASGQIVARFDALAATDVTVTPRTAAGPVVSRVIPWDAAGRIRRLAGVVAAGTSADVDVKGALVRSVPLNDPSGQSTFQLPVKAASPELFAAIRARVASGRVFDEGHSVRGDRVAVLGPAAADRLNLSGVDQQPAIFIGERLYLVVGVLSDVARQADMLGAVIIPEGTARHEFGLVAPGSVQIDTEIGAARLIAQQAPIALNPDNPALFRVAQPPDAQGTKNAVKNDLNALFIILGLVSLLVGALGIANVTLVSVLERIGEIGLRRALGAGRRHIAAQFLTESALMGLFGGIIGASLGTSATVLVAISRHWTPILDPKVPLLAPLVGTVIGLISGLYPAWRAARLQPVEALRSAI